MLKKEMLRSGFNRIQNLSTNFKPVTKTRSDEQNSVVEPTSQLVATEIEESLRSTTIADSVSEIDTVQIGQSPKETVSIRDSVKTNFTQVPNWILRASGLFTDPVDFMVYMHLFTFSYGFQKTRASMSQTQLMSFTNSSKNCIKRSLDRLEKQGLIEQWEDFEHGRVSRVWKVNFPKDPKGSKKTASNLDTVQNGQSPELTDSVSKTDTLTVSNLDTTQYNKQINLKHTLPESLKVYFENLKPERKRKQEEGAFKELTREFSLDQIESALLHIQKHGIGEHKEKPHSPMAYLAVAMESVLLKCINKTDKTELSIKFTKNDTASERMDSDTLFYEVAKNKFNELFENEEKRNKYISNHHSNRGILTKNGEIQKRLAIIDWYSKEYLTKE